MRPGLRVSLRLLERQDRFVDVMECEGVARHLAGLLLLRDLETWKSDLKQKKKYMTTDQHGARC